MRVSYLCSGLLILVAAGCAQRPAPDVVPPAWSGPEPVDTADTTEDTGVTAETGGRDPRTPRSSFRGRLRVHVPLRRLDRDQWVTAWPVHVDGDELVKAGGVGRALGPFNARWRTVRMAVAPHPEWVGPVSGGREGTLFIIGGFESDSGAFDASSTVTQLCPELVLWDDFERSWYKTRARRAADGGDLDLIVGRRATELVPAALEHEHVECIRDAALVSVSESDSLRITSLAGNGVQTSPPIDASWHEYKKAKYGEICLTDLNPSRIHDDWQNPQVQSGWERVALYRDLDASGSFGAEDLIVGYACTVDAVPLYAVYVDPRQSVEGLVLSVDLYADRERSGRDDNPLLGWNYIQALDGEYQAPEGWPMEGGIWFYDNEECR